MIKKLNDCVLNGSHTFPGTSLFNVLMGLLVGLLDSTSGEQKLLIGYIYPEDQGLSTMFHGGIDKFCCCSWKIVIMKRDTYFECIAFLCEIFVHPRLPQPYWLAGFSRAVWHGRRVGGACLSRQPALRHGSGYCALPGLKSQQGISLEIRSNLVNSDWGKFSAEN